MPWSRASHPAQHILALSPEAKGRVERANGAFQDRLVAELRLAGARTLHEANHVLQEFLPHFNTRFGVPAAQPGSAYRPLAPGLDLAGVICFKERRTVAKVEWHRGELFPRMGFIVTTMTARPEGVVHFYNGRGTAEQWIKEGKYALNWTRLSCHRFVANQVRLWLFILAYNLGNFLRRLGLPKAIKDWSP